MSDDSDDYNHYDDYDDHDDEHSDKKSEHKSEGKKNELEEGQVKQIQAIIMDCNCQVKSKIIIFGESEETSYLLEKSKKPLFPKKFFNEKITFQQMQEDFQQALGTGEVLYHWANSMDPEELYFVTYESVNGYGCEHYVTNIHFKCQECSKFFGCPYCHEAQFGFEQEPHKFQPSAIKCLKCKTEQEFKLDQKQCTNCKCELFTAACLKCGYSSLNRQFFHCDQCQACVDGVQSLFKHCEKCKQCVKAADYETHKTVCGRNIAEKCQLCMGEFDQMFMRRCMLHCGHDTHFHCLQKAKTEGQDSKFKCPSCQQPAQTKSEGAAERQKFISKYAIAEIPQYKLGQYVNVTCLQCEKQFVKHWHPLGYICPFCDNVNCTQGADYTDIEKGEQFVKEQYKMMREDRHTIPIYPLILWPKDKYEEMADMIQDYVLKYQDYWIECRKKMTTCPFEMPLRELVNAYCLVRDIDETVGFAALNLCHARKVFPPLDQLETLALTCAECMAEVKETKRLNIQ